MRFLAGFVSTSSAIPFWFPREATPRSGSAVVKGLERLGFVVARQSGSHVRLVKGGKRVTRALVWLVGRGHPADILRQAGLEIETLMESL